MLYHVPQRLAEISNPKVLPTLHCFLPQGSYLLSAGKIPLILLGSGFTSQKPCHAQQARKAGMPEPLGW